MKKILRYKSVSILCHIILAVIVLPYVILYPKSVSLLFINGHHTPTLDVIMYHITRLPELAFIVFVVILALFAERRMFLAVVVGMALSGLSIILFKNFIFPDFHRPFHWLSGNHVDFHHVPGIHLHSNGSFPSGHTISAFCSLAFIGFMSKSKGIQFILFIVAVASGYSRVYAAQHYLMDVYAGALIGFAFALIMTQLSELIFRTPYWNKPMITFTK